MSGVNYVLHKYLQQEKSFVFDRHGRKVAVTLPPIYEIRKLLSRCTA